MPCAIILAAGSSTRLGQLKQNIRIANETLLERSVRIAHTAGLDPIFVVLPPGFSSPTFDLALEEYPPAHLDTPSPLQDSSSLPERQTAPSSAPERRQPPTRCERLINHQASEGMASSIRLGVQSAIQATATGAVILACDQIAVTPEHLRALTQNHNEIRASAYAGRKGIPAYFPESSLTDLLKLCGDTGARDLLRHAVAILLVDGDLDIDTPADLDRARQLYPDR